MKKILLVLLLYYPLEVYTQVWTLEYSAGYATYQLNDIKKIQQSMINNYGLKETDCFPNYITHSVAGGLVAKIHHIGINFSYLTTGGRLHTADYSGSYTVDMVMNGYRLGLFDRCFFNQDFLKVAPYLQMGMGVLFSNLKINEQVRVYSEYAKDITKLESVGMYLEPSIGTMFRFSERLHFSIRGGYEFDLLGTLKLNRQKTETIANWNGFRLYEGLILNFPVKR